MGEMADQFPVLIVLAPMFGALLTVLLGSRNQSLCFPIALGSLLLSLVTAGMTLSEAVSVGEIRYRLGGWAPPFGIEYRIDAINGIVVFAIAAVGVLTTVFASSRILEETPGRVSSYYTLFLLLLAGLMGMTVTNDAFNLYVLLEISSLTSYALVAMGQRRAVLASFNYVIMGTIGASFYLLGVGYLYIKTGSLNMDDIREIIQAENLQDSTTIRVGFILIMLGVWVKMAFFPLHGWLPNAYSYSPTATGTIMAPLVTKVMIYIMIRMMVSVFGYDYIFQSLGWSHVIVWISIIAIVAGSLLALARTELKKMLTYLIIAEVGYMVGGAWLANESGMVGAIYHILSDAVMTLCLFMAASIIVIRTGDPRLVTFRGLFRRMPMTMIGFTVGALSMIGLPPTCGFFSKWYLIKGGLEAGQYAFVGALVFSSLVNAVLFFRIFELAYFSKIESEPDPLLDADAAPAQVMSKVPTSMLLPLYAAAACVFIVGLANRPIAGWISSTLKNFGFPG